MLSHEITQRWLSYFEARDHHVVPSASLVSQQPGAMFTIAGMVPFIPYFLGQETPPYQRATSVQKCIRTLDIDEVGKTARHGTFFQMAGNFSFGDYFKSQAIPMAWELLTTAPEQGGFGLDPERLWVTVYEGDQESYDLWHDTVGLPAQRIQRMGRDENYWDTGQPGPAGPDSEIFYDRGPRYGKDGGPAVDDDRYIEIWNLVFMQYQRGEGNGKDYEILGELPRKNIDTGLGVERLAMLLQGVENFYETDQVRPVLDAAAKLSGRTYHGAEKAGEQGYDDDVRMRVVADHVRSSLMLIADGVTPGNEGRGYILRRLLRRAVRAMRLLGVTEPCLPVLLPESRDAMKGVYPVVAEDFERISRIAYAEERAFLKTIESGTTRLEHAVEVAKGEQRALSGADAFALHDTFGFPIDLTLEMAEEAGVSVDETAFRALMAEQRQRAQEDARAKKGALADLSELRRMLDDHGSEFTGYTELVTPTTVRAILSGGVSVPAASEGEHVEVVLERTPFYAEAGGQAADVGTIDSSDGAQLTVEDVQQPVKGLSVHKVTVSAGQVLVGDEVTARVDSRRRHDGEAAHSGTHVIHAALHDVLGPDAVQRGSFNKEGYLRFDFSHGEALNAGQIQEIEQIANTAIRDDFEVVTREMPLAEAKKLGAMSLFGEKYGDEVRVVEMNGPWSRELCGGTHVGSTSQLGSLSLVSEQSVGSGNRRVEALVGLNSFNHLAAERTLVNQLTGMLKVQSSAELPERLAATLDKLKETERQLAGLRQQQLQAQAGQLARDAERVGPVTAVLHDAGEIASADALRSLALDLRTRLGSEPAVAAVTGVANDRPLVVVAVNDAARDAGLAAGQLVRTAATTLGGGGGGKPDVAQGGGSDAAKIPDALAAIRRQIQSTAG
ncbi:alanine--tRNA ligase [Kocuria rhizophila]|uniref:Alanine--tRNA ligase n=1 Tax=Kocuria rhizophila (strain ATCC 9341 / DSM 348 / NBRC 103217 / DC2201) TaxID=378753 RepID=SYA_KOCRD|nr:alanine--tRNA ligase [Kocuria rhizophila]B2GIA1.1 RecName: Full=Alanine--tRNA ligase; AltName: Full=Alanyl-tRNA synthetase; Short=AlaRS [Kocuria rhizophila DC2201]ASE10437.1 alanine--tRNA ligase [Kocuria rhizophila]MBK4120193.1 alanine--tRNA ligase [Kocuria rhizophila]MCC5671742.1 alanine--tRNA ligase [Kocuria rhizophila]VEH75031.1 Alanine--tRNA ligase [Kocuria rhizophila]BAG29693.1 alanyl-tRNA synthetase [Kocuria rhizophila DC2201]